MKYKFIDNIPDEIIKEDVLYISLEYDITKHKCPCGCGSIIVASLSPARYSITYDGESVSLYPSIGNWNLPCKSHYFIRNGKIIWAGQFNDQQIKKVIQNDHRTLKEYSDKKSKPQNPGMNRYI